MRYEAGETKVYIGRLINSVFGHDYFSIRRSGIRMRWNVHWGPKFLCTCAIVFAQLLYAEDVTAIYQRDCTAVFKMVDAAANARSSPAAPDALAAIGCSYWIVESTVEQRAKEVVPRIKRWLDSENEFERQASHHLLSLACLLDISPSFLQELLTEKELDSLLQSTSDEDKLLGLDLVRTYYGKLPERFRAFGLSSIKHSDHRLRDQGWKLLLALPNTPETEAAVWQAIESEQDYGVRNSLVSKVGYLKPASKQNLLRLYSYIHKDDSGTRNAAFSGLMNQPEAIGLISDELRKASTGPNSDAEQKRYIVQLIKGYELFLQSLMHQTELAPPKPVGKVDVVPNVLNLFGFSQ